jgi:hypothetical protein
MVGAPGMDFPGFPPPSAIQESLRKIGLSDDEYASAVDQLKAVFPQDWAEGECEKITQKHHGVRQVPLHVAPGSYLMHHPIPCLLLMPNLIVSTSFCELLALGRDLFATKHISGIQGIRKKLRDEQQFSSSLFEVEVLAEFARGKLSPEKLPERRNQRTPDAKITAKGTPIYAEIQNRGAPRWRSIVSLLFLELAFKDFGHITLTFDPKRLGSAKERDDVLAARIGCEVVVIVERASAVTGHDAAGVCKIDYDPQGDPRSVTFVYQGGSSTERDLIASAVVNTLLNKEVQLQDEATAGHKCIVAMDFRSILVAGLDEAQKTAYTGFYATHSHAYRSNLIQAVQEFVSRSNVVSGVLGWWRKSELHMTPRERVFDPFRLSLITEHGETELGQGSTLEELLSLIDGP